MNENNDRANIIINKVNYIRLLYFFLSNDKSYY